MAPLDLELSFKMEFKRELGGWTGKFAIDFDIKLQSCKNLKKNVNKEC